MPRVWRSKYDFSLDGGVLALNLHWDETETHRPHMLRGKVHPKASATELKVARSWMDAVRAARSRAANLEDRWLLACR